MSDTNQRPQPPGKAESLFAAWAARVEAGERLEFESVARRHPECARELEQLHDDWLQFAPLLSRVVPGLVASESGVLVPPLASAKDDDAPPSSDELFARLGLHGAGESRYRFRAVIGRGGGEVVLRVWDSKLNRALAMKVVLGREEERLSGDTPRVDGRTLSRFVDEARIAAQLNHPGIVPVHELGADDAGRAFFTMKLVKGEDLARIFEKVFTGEGDWNQPRALGYLLRVCEAMAYAHDKGVVHRDLKPANVMVGPYGEVHVMDWGLARVLGEKDPRDLRIRPQPQPPISAVDSFRAGERKAQADSPLITMDGAAVGTPAYMSPEQARGELEDVGPRSDVYAVGAMLYHLLTGEPPFSPRGAHVPQLVVLTNVMHGPPKPVEELSPRAAPELVAICEKAMQRQSTSRYGSMLELAADLRAFLEGRVVEAYETGTWAETKKWVQRNRALAGSLLVTVLAIAALIAVLIWAFRRQKEEAEVARQSVQRAKQAEGEAREAAAQAGEAALAAEDSAYFAAIIGAQAALNANEPASARRLLDSAPERLRNWEWGHLNAILDTSLLTLVGHSPNWSPDGTRIVTALDNFSVCVWDVESGRPVTYLGGHTNAVNTTGFSANGGRVVTASRDHTVRIWDSANGRELVKLVGHTESVQSASFSKDGTRVLTMSDDYTARVWDAATGREVAAFPPDTGPYSRAHWSVSVEFSPDGARVLSLTSEGVPRVLDALSGREIVAFTAGGTSVHTASFSRDGRYALAIPDDKSVLVWDASSGAALAKLVGHTAQVGCASFSPDGTRVASGSQDNSARVWDAASGRELARFHGHTDAVRFASFSPDGARIVTVSDDFTARVWDGSTGRELAKLQGHTDKVQHASFSPDGTRIVTESRDGTARVWAVNCPSEFMKIGEHSDGFASARFSPSGEYVVTTCEDGTARVWDPSSAKALVMLVGHTAATRCANFDSSGSRIATTSDDDTVRTWDVMSGHELAKFEGPSNVRCAALSPDGSRVVVTTDDTVSVWDAASEQETARIEGHTSRVESAMFSPDGHRIVTASHDGTARTWDAASGRELAKLAGHTDQLHTASFSPDGTRIVTASSDGTARIWDSATGAELMTFEGHVGSVFSAGFSPDNTRVVTASEDKTVRVWDAMRGRELAKLKGHSSWVLDASFSADGKRILTLSEVGEAFVWDGVQYAARVDEREALEAARPEGERKLAEVLSYTREFVAAGERLRALPWLDPRVRRAALDLLSARCNTARERAQILERDRAHRGWISHMLGSPRRGSETEAEAALNSDSSLPTTAKGLSALANRLLDAEPAPGAAVRALALARRAAAAAPDSSRGSGGAMFVTFDRSAALRTLARALFRLGRFDEALVEQRRALSEALGNQKAEYQTQLEQLEADIAEWRDENGQLRVAKWTAKLEELDRQIAELEADPDVRMWLAYKR